MEKEKMMRVGAIVVGLLVSILFLWFAFRLVENRFSRASTTVTNATCQEGGNPSEFTVTFDIGRESSNVDVEWGVSQTSLTSIAPADCSGGTTCEAHLTLVPTGATPFYRVLIDGSHIGVGGESADTSAPPFNCSSESTTGTNTNAQQVVTATPMPPTPTPTVEVCAAIREKFGKGDAVACSGDFNARDCAKCLFQIRSTDSSSDRTPTTSPSVILQ